MTRRPHFLVIRRRYLGDIVLLSSFLRNLRLQAPRARLSVLVGSAYAEVLPLHPEVDAGLSFPTRAAGWLSLLRRLRRDPVTQVFDLDNTAKTALITRLTGAPQRHVFHLQGVRRHLPRCYTHTTFVSSPDYSSRPITETYLAMLAAAGVPLATREIRLTPPASELAAARAWLGDPSRPHVLIHPGSRSPFRQWPAERLAAVSDRLQAEGQAAVHLVAGPGEEALLTAIRARTQRPVNSSRSDVRVPQLAALAAHATVVLCHDSGPMHVAAAVGTPVVALYGSQDATIWRPPGEGHRCLQAPQPCRDCVSPGLCVPGDSYRNHCVRRVAIDDVHAALQAVLGRTLSRR